MEVGYDMVNKEVATFIKKSQGEETKVKKVKVEDLLNNKLLYDIVNLSNKLV